MKEQISTLQARFLAKKYNAWAFARTPDIIAGRFCQKQNPPIIVAKDSAKHAIALLIIDVPRILKIS